MFVQGLKENYFLIKSGFSMLDDAKKLGFVFCRLNENIRNHFEDSFDQVRTIKTPYGEMGEIMYHIFESPNIWINFLTNKTIEVKPYNELTTKELFYAEWKMVEARLTKYLENSKELDYGKRMHIKFEDDGFEMDTSIEELLMHISHHAFYHRGTVGALARENNLAPLPSSNWFFSLK